MTWIKCMCGEVFEDDENKDNANQKYQEHLEKVLEEHTEHSGGTGSSKE